MKQDDYDFLFSFGFGIGVGVGLISGAIFYMGVL